MMNYKERRIEAIKKVFPKPVSSGKGLVNSLINHCPFELHPPNFSFLGPGTNVDLRLEKGIRPSNKLDSLALDHDLAYSASNDLSKRHEADKILQEGAWNRFLDPKASVGERGMAYLTTNAMKAKRALGMGLTRKKKKKKTVTYIDHPVNLTEEEISRISIASEKKRPIDIVINLFRTKDSIMNGSSLPLTLYQIKKIKKARKENKNSIKLKLSSKQLQHFKQGGFLPALVAAAPAVASVLGTIYNSYQNKKANDRLVEEKIRHNRALEGKGLYMNKKPKALGGNVLLKELLKKKKTLR